MISETRVKKLEEGRIRPFYYRDFSDFQNIWREFIFSEVSEVDRFLQPVKFSRLNFCWSKLFGLNSFWDNFLVYELDNKIIGFMEILPRPRKKDEFFIRNFVFSAPSRNKGFGSVFLDGVMNMYSGAREFSLEVRKDNPALNFYKKMGFTRIASRYNMVLISEKNTYHKDDLKGLRFWHSRTDWNKLNYLIELSDMEDSFLGVNLIPYFSKLNYFDDYFDELFRKYMGQKMDVYLLEDKGEIKIYGVLYFYRRYRAVLMEFVYLPYLSQILIESFVKAVIGKINPGMKLLLTATSSQQAVRMAFEDIGGRIYRETEVMVRENRGKLS